MPWGTVWNLSLHGAMHVSGCFIFPTSVLCASYVFQSDKLFFRKELVLVLASLSLVLLSLETRACVSKSCSHDCCFDERVSEDAWGC